MNVVHETVREERPETCITPALTAPTLKKNDLSMVKLLLSDTTKAPPLFIELISILIKLQEFKVTFKSAALDS